MADEVYEGAIGIDLGTVKPDLSPQCALLNSDQAPHTHVSPIMREPMSKSVCGHNLQLLKNLC
jgi:hypothetical protein